MGFWRGVFNGVGLCGWRAGLYGVNVGGLRSKKFSLSSLFNMKVGLMAGVIRSSLGLSVELICKIL